MAENEKLEQTKQAAPKKDKKSDLMCSKSIMVGV